MKFLITIAILLAASAASTAIADDAAPLDFTLSSAVDYEFDNALIERKQLAPGVKVRGWEISEQVYFGQAKVADRWGLGLVFEDGDTVYGVNHRGVQWMKRF
jgi:hypothetical protein